MKKKLLNHETTVCFIAFVVLFILLATVWMVSGKIVYDAIYVFDSNMNISYNNHL